MTYNQIKNMEDLRNYLASRKGDIVYRDNCGNWFDLNPDPDYDDFPNCGVIYMPGGDSNNVTLRKIGRNEYSVLSNGNGYGIIKIRSIKN